MEQWKKIALILCTFGFLRDLRPSEPFVAEFILGPWRNITQQELNQEIFPVCTYSYLAQLIAAFLITDFLRYKPLIILMGASGIIMWNIYLWTTSKFALQVFEFLYGTQMASEVAYYTYMYTKVEKENYIKVTSYTRTASLVGKLMSGVTGQALIYTKLMDYRDLNYISLITQIMATIWAFFLPGSKTSLYFHREPCENYLERKDEEGKLLPPTTRLENIKEGFGLLWRHFQNAYSNTMVLQWSIWYVVALCGYQQVVAYIQILWNSIDNSVVWNGGVHAIRTLAGAILAMLAGYVYSAKMNADLSMLGLSLLYIIQGLCVLLASWTNSLVCSYVGYILFGALAAFTLTVSSSEVSRHLTEESYGLIFGFNTFVALGLQTMILLLVISKQGFALDIVGQYTVFALYFLVVGVVYAVVLLIQHVIGPSPTNESIELPENGIEN